MLQVEEMIGLESHYFTISVKTDSGKNHEKEAKIIR